MLKVVKYLDKVYDYTLEEFCSALTTFFISSFSCWCTLVAKSLNNKMARKFLSIHSKQVLRQNRVTVKLSQRFVEPEWRSGTADVRAPSLTRVQPISFIVCNASKFLGCKFCVFAWHREGESRELEVRNAPPSLSNKHSPSPFLLNWTRPARIFLALLTFSMESRAPSICQLNSNCNWLLNADARNWKKSAACVCVCMWATRVPLALLLTQNQ